MRTILAGRGRRTIDGGDSDEARWDEHHSVQLLIVGKEMMTQTVPIKKFHNIFSVGDKLDRAKYRALRNTTTVKGPLRSFPDIKVCVRPDRYDWNQDNVTPATEKRSLRMDVRQSWSTVSKAELTSSRINKWYNLPSVYEFCKPRLPNNGIMIRVYLCCYQLVQSSHGLTR